MRKWRGRPGRAGRRLTSGITATKRMGLRDCVTGRARVDNHWSTPRRVRGSRNGLSLAPSWRGTGWWRISAAFVYVATCGLKAFRGLGLVACRHDHTDLSDFGAARAVRRLGARHIVRGSGKDNLVAG